MQYPQRRISSAWNLVDSKYAIGFSGTDDNRFLLPYQVNQIQHADEELRATNGRMIDLVLSCTKGIIQIQTNQSATWKTILDECFQLKVQALIDTGGLMAGSEINSVVSYVSTKLQHGHSVFRGFVYYSAANKGWEVFEAAAGLVKPVVRASLSAIECLESEVLAQATTHARSIGDGVVVAGGIGVEECEKEVFAEFEQDEEREEAATSQEPRSQTDWDYQLVFDNPSCLFGSVFHQLSDLIEECGVTEMTAIPWWNGVFCTLNVWETIEKAKECGSLSQYLRLVDPLLVFPDRRVVLISLYELDNLLPLWWGQSCRPRVSIDHVFRLVSNCPQLGYWSLPVSTKALVSLKLFRGDVKYNSDGEKRILRQMLEDLDSPIDTLKQLLSTRSRLSHYEQSDLAKVAFLSSLPRPSPGVKKRPFENREVNTANKKQRSPFVLKGEGARSAQSAIRKQSHSSLLKKISNILKKHRFIDDDAKTQAK
ncbi:unnamed protein product [Cylindrotheca closterium]|uniref:Uncharacterized protein n=1 Tax=Cylindrotheca closterium TaxID=2856 RepID=A0AAD2FT04_9STRA|nr:unnamed protein product [Cylindrotheca closterium]